MVHGSWFTVNGDGTIIEDVILCADEGRYGVNIPKGVWHSLKCLESGTILLEAKDGAYRPLEEDEVWNG